MVGTRIIPGPLETATETTSTAWIRSALHTTPCDVGMLVPDDFTAYARLLHRGDQHTATGTHPVRWAEVAHSTGTRVHAHMQWDSIAPAVPWFDEPETGTLAVECAAALAVVLRQHTTTPESCWFGIWHGKQPLRVPNHAPLARFALRDMYVLRGPVSGLTQNLAPEPHLSLPQLAWPEDRAWVMATDVDQQSTYLAASTPCVEAILAHPELETFRVGPTDSITAKSDRLNGPGGRATQ